MFARSIRLESQFHILMETLEDGVVGVNERGEVFACNRHAEEITRSLTPTTPSSSVSIKIWNWLSSRMERANIWSKL